MMPSARPQVRLSKKFGRALHNLENDLRAWGRDGTKKVERVYQRGAQKWKREAQRRVPVGPQSGNLRQKILANVYVVSGGYVAEVGTNVREYPIYLEFGTEFIAAGAVKSLGDDPHISDVQAITTWPALEARGGSNQQMPWLRPSFVAIVDWWIDEIDRAFKPPKQKRKSI